MPASCPVGRSLKAQLAVHSRQLDGRYLRHYECCAEGQASPSRSLRGLRKRQTGSYDLFLPAEAKFRLERDAKGLRASNLKVCRLPCRAEENLGYPASPSQGVRKVQARRPTAGGRRTPGGNEPAI